MKTESKKTKKLLKNEKNQAQRSPKIIIRRILNILIYIFGALLVVCYGLILAFQIAQQNHATLFGYSLFTVGSGSMEPTLSIHDKILIKESNEYQPDDIVTYVINGENYVTHRILSIEDGKAITKGDANNTEDDPVEVSSIIGKFVKKASFLDFIHTNRILILAGFCILLFLFYILKK